MIRRALIVYNKPLYELHLLEQQDPFYQKMLKRRHFTTLQWKGTYEEHAHSLVAVEQTLRLLGLDVEKVYRKELQSLKGYDLIVTVGGDGTFLETSHRLARSRSILLGVNAAPSDSTGALCRGRCENFLSLVVDLMTGALAPKSIPRLKIKINGRALPHYALNDILFANKSPAGTSRYVIERGKRREEHKSSGIWIAAPTGSTAAVRSSGGKPMPVDAPRFQYAVREIFTVGIPKPFRLLRGELGAGERLVLHPKMRQAMLFVDGNHLELPLQYGDRVEIGLDAPRLLAVL